MIARVFPYRLPLKRRWVAASVSMTERAGALLRLTDDAGRCGWGDCAPLPSRVDAPAVLAALEAFALHPGAGAQALAGEARWAVDTARADLAAQRRGLPLWRLLGAKRGSIEVNAALGPLDDGAPQRAAAAAAQGFRIGKFKVGLAPVAEDIARLRSLERGLRLRLDANRAWSDAQAHQFIDAVADLPIDALEEPLAVPTPGRLARLQADARWPLAVDESLPLLGLDALIAARAVRRLVLKPARLGAIAATRAIAMRARAAGLEVVITSVVDSAVGLTAAAHLAAAIAPDAAHGLGTADWFADDVADAPALVAGWLHLPQHRGLGLRVRGLQ